MIRQQTVWVRNNGAEPFRDRYNGEDFTIEPGEFEEMLVETAELCLGFGEDDKTRVIRRLGLAFTRDDMPQAMVRLGEFSFHMSEKEARSHIPGSTAPAGDDETRADPNRPARAVVRKKYKKRKARSKKIPPPQTLANAEQAQAG